MDLHRAHLAAVATAPGVHRLGRGREGVGDFRDLVHYYRLTADNRILFGGRDVGLWDGRSVDRDSDPAVFARLRTDFATTFPSLSDVAFTHERGGPASVTLNLFPWRRR